MSRPHWAIVGTGVVAAVVIARWLFDRPSISLHQILGDNYDLLTAEERKMARQLLLAGQECLLRNWPRPGIKDAQKRALVRAASRKLDGVSTDLISDRLATLQAPIAQQKPHTLTTHGDTREDPYYWLRDDSREDPEVLAHIKAENEYTAAVLAPTEPLQKQLFQEMKGRIQETDQSVAVRRNGWYYYTNTFEGKQYGVHCRRPVPKGAGAETEASTMDTSETEQVLLDENTEAAKHSFYSTAAVTVSPDGALLCYTEDTVGGEKYIVKVIDIETRQSVLSEPIGDCSGNVLWAADSETLFFVKQDEKMRPFQVYRQRLDGSAELVYEDLDEAYYVHTFKTSDKQLIVIESGATLQNELLYLPAASPEGEFQMLFPRQPDIDIGVDHWHGSLFLTKRTKATLNSELLIAPLADPTVQRSLLPHRAGAKIEDIAVCNGFCAVLERSATAGLQEVTVFALPATKEAADVDLSQGDKLTFDDDAFALSLAGTGDFDSTVLLLTYSSLTTPTTWLAHDMATGARSTRKVSPVLGGFDKSDYATERLWATSHDGVKVPVSVVYSRAALDRTAPAPLHLDAYGAYEICNDATFSRNRLSLLDRGVAFAIAHVRGGGDLGRQWYETGKFLTKKNTFLDTIAAAEHLIEEGWTQADKLTLEGRSAGGLTVGGVVNMRPELFTGVVAGVPFVDTLTTMLDDSIPLTVGEYDEWGNPNEEVYYHYMKEYSPVDNVAAQAYPKMLVTAGLHDPRVAYWEPAKFVAKLRRLKTDDHMLLFKCDLGAGHFSQSGRFDRLKELAIDYAFVLLCADRMGAPLAE